VYTIAGRKHLWITSGGGGGDGGSGAGHILCIIAVVVGPAGSSWIGRAH